MEWNITSLIGAVTLTMKQLGFGTDDIDLTVFGTIRIQQRFTPEAVQKAGISWIARILPETLFRGMADDEMGDALQKLADDFEKRISDTNDIRHEK